MISASTDPEVGITGLHRGEEVHEHLRADEPRDVRRKHPHVVRVPVPPISPREADGLPTRGDTAGIRDAMADMCELPTISRRL